MDKSWDRKSFEVGGHWPLWRGMKKTNDHAEPTKSRTLKYFFKYINCNKELYILASFGFELITFLYQKTVNLSSGLSLP